MTGGWLRPCLVSPPTCERGSVEFLYTLTAGVPACACYQPSSFLLEFTAGLSVPYGALVCSETERGGFVVCRDQTYKCMSSFFSLDYLPPPLVSIKADLAGRMAKKTNPKRGAQNRTMPGTADTLGYPVE